MAPGLADQLCHRLLAMTVAVNELAVGRGFLDRVQIFALDIFDERDFRGGALIEVAQAIPMGMVMSVAYGPEVHFAEAPKDPKWAVTVRYKSTGSLMRGMAAMMGGGLANRSP